MPPTATKEKPENENKLTEEESVILYRRICFLEIFGLDFDKDIIEELTYSKVDHHDANRLKKTDCPLDLIPKILL